MFPWSICRERRCFKMGGGSSGGSSQPTVVNQNTEPWAGQKSFLSAGDTPSTGLYQLANQAYTSMNKTPWSGDLIARPTTGQTQANTQRLDIADQLAGSGYGNNVMQMGNDMLAGKYLDPSSNPYLQSTIAAALNPVTERYIEQILPQIRSRAVSGGAYEGSAPEFSATQAAGDFARETGDIASRIAYQNYATERANQLNAPGLIQQALGMQLMPSSIYEGVGETQQAWNQDLLNEAIQKYGMAQQAPWTGLSEYAGLVTAGTPGQSSSANYQYATPSRGSQIFQGALGGGVLGGLAGNVLGDATGWGLAPWGFGGAVLGGLGGGFF